MWRKINCLVFVVFLILLSVSATTDNVKEAELLLLEDLVSLEDEINDIQQNDEKVEESEIQANDFQSFEDDLNHVKKKKKKLIRVVENGKFQSFEDDLNHVKKKKKKLIRVVENGKGNKKPDDEVHANGDVFDEILTKEQKQRLAKTNTAGGTQDDEELGISRRKIEPLYKLWPNGVVHWAFDPKRPFKEQASLNTIWRSLWHWGNNTCLRFPTRTNQAYYVSVGTGGGCSSYVGRVPSSYQPQTLKLAEPGCLSSIGTPVHEIGHAIGFSHEQSRKDRDAYVHVRLDHISPSRINNFLVKDQARLLAPYDLSSDMHYGTSGFATGPYNTIDVRQPDLEDLAGSRLGLSFYDIMAVTDGYKCTQNCPSMTCKNGGFVHTTDPLGTASPKCQCKCPDGLTDPCDKVDPVQSAIGCQGGVFTMSAGAKRTIKTKNKLDGRTNYGSQDKCVWFFKASHPDRRLRISFSEFDILSSGGCRDNVDIRYNLAGQRGFKYCGPAFDQPAIVSYKDTLLIKFHSSSSTSSHKGFVALVEEIPEPGCRKGPCRNGGTCENNGAEDFVCKCTDGFTGKTCDEVTGTQTVSCDFQTKFEVNDGLCFLKQDTNDDADFTIFLGNTATGNTGPTGDKEIGGFYVYLEANGLSSGKKARLITSSFQGRRCLKFAYNMYGSNMGQLSVKTRTSSGVDKVVWTKSGNQQSPWHVAVVDVDSTTSLYQIVFEATRGSGILSDIALDDIEVYHGACPSNPPSSKKEPVSSTSCDFEKNLCSFEQDWTTDTKLFNWIRHRGRTSSSGTGPNTDHTTGSGYYVFIESSPWSNGNTARLLSPRLQFSSGHFCVNFWYHAYGSSLGTLKVYKRMDGSTTLNNIWTLSSGSENKWKKASLSLTAQSADIFRLVFEGTDGSSYLSDFALDDISITCGTCSGQNNQCSAPAVTTTSVPVTTTMSPAVDGKWGTWTNSSCTASCGSGTTTHVRQCNSPQPSNGGSQCKKVDGSLGLSEQITVSCNLGPCPTSPPIVDGKWGTWTNSSCTASCGTGTTTHVRQCNSPQPSNGGSQCVKVDGSLGLSEQIIVSCNLGQCPTSPPIVDGKWGTWTNSSCTASCGTGTTTHVRQCNSPQPSNGGSQCMKVDGSLGLSERITVSCNLGPCSTSSPIVNGQWSQWIDSSCSMSCGQGSATRTRHCDNPPPSNGGFQCTKINGSHALTETIVQTCNLGSCSTQPGSSVSSIECHFENGLCGFIHDQSGKFNWLRRHGGTPSSNTGPYRGAGGKGYYIYIEATRKKRGDYAVISTPLISPSTSGDMCLSFKYHGRGRDLGSLEVLTESSGYLTSQWLTTKESLRRTWQEVNITLAYLYSDFQVLFNGTVGRSYRGDYALDDVKVTPGKCHLGPIVSSFNCTFEYGSCGLKADHRSSFLWRRRRGRTPSRNTGPSAGVGGRGYYIHIEATRKRPGDIAIMATPWIRPPSNGSMCLSFHYHGYGSGLGTLAVSTENTYQYSTIPRWNTSVESPGRNWHRVDIQLTMHELFKVLLNGSRGVNYRGDYAVDNVQVTPGICRRPNNEQEVSSVNCSFNYNTCQFKNDLRSSFFWTRRFGYMYFQAARKTAGDRAILATPWIRPPTTGRMCLTFKVFGYGAAGDIAVSTTDKNSHTLPYWSKHSSGRLWKKVKVNLIEYSLFKVLFNGTVGNNARGYYAIDNVAVTPGDCPVNLGCNFEKGFCDFTQDTNDDFDWTRRKGRTPSSRTGPYRASQGLHYAYIETSRHANGDVAILKSPAISKADHYCMTFDYSHYGSSLGHLTVELYQQGNQSRTLWTGSNRSRWSWSRHVSVEFDAQTGDKFAFKGKRGRSFRGDYAIDNIKVHSCPPGVSDGNIEGLIEDF